MLPVLVIVDICPLIVNNVLLRSQLKLLRQNAFLIFGQLTAAENFNTLKNLALMDTLICDFQFNSFIMHTDTSRNHLHYIMFWKIFKQKCHFQKSFVASKISSVGVTVASIMLLPVLFR